jgi:H+/Cl- antiporter ClcA
MLFASIGLVAVLAGAANTPIAASIMAIELFGPQIAPYAAIACVISFFITGHRSVYPSQVLGIRKSRYLNVKLGQEIEKI